MVEDIMKEKIDVYKLVSLITSYVAYICLLVSFSINGAWNDVNIQEMICIVCIFICLFFESLVIIRDIRRNKC